MNEHSVEVTWQYYSWGSLKFNDSEKRLILFNDEHKTNLPIAGALTNHNEFNVGAIEFRIAPDDALIGARLTYQFYVGSRVMYSGLVMDYADFIGVNNIFIAPNQNFDVTFTVEDFVFYGELSVMCVLHGKLKRPIQ